LSAPPEYQCFAGMDFSGNGACHLWFVTEIFVIRNDERGHA